MSATLSVALRGQAGAQAYAVEFVAKARPIVMIGPNGAGKTTVLRTIAGALTGLGGRITLGARVLLDTESGVHRPPEERRVGYVPQTLGLFPHLTVWKNVTFGCGADPDGPARARQQLALLEVEHLSERRPGSLSGGERQRVALARALTMQPEALLLDEPLGALDVGQRRRTRERLAEHLRQAGIPTVVVTHDLRDALALDGEIVVLADGHVVDRGDIGTLRKNPASEFISEFLAPMTAAAER